VSSRVDSIPDPATQARLHLVLADHAGPAVDWFVDGAVAVNGGQQQVNIHPEYVTAYVYLTPGAHRVAVAPTNQGVTKALSSIDAPLAAGHRYLVAFMGQVTDNTVKPVLIDETAEAARIGATSTDSVTITLNNVGGSSGVDYTWAGRSVAANIPYGGYQAGIVPAGNAHITLTATGATDVAVINEDNYALPGDSDFGLTGTNVTSSGDAGVIDAATTTDLNVVDTLQLYDATRLLPGSTFPSFTTTLAAIKTAGLTDLYTTGGPVLFLPPTDQAFAAMPATQRDALLADPSALATMLRAHTIAGYVPRGSLAATPGGSFDRTFTNLNGDPITISGDYNINGTSPGDYASVWTANGSQLHAVDALTFAPAKS
jgi:uncharacterized surface protein with fasciclin (FAS1) repeats